MPIPISKQAADEKLLDTLEKSVAALHALQKLDYRVLDDAQVVRLKTLTKELYDMQCVAIARARNHGRLSSDLMRICKLDSGKAAAALKQGVALLKVADEAAQAAAKALVTQERDKRQAHTQKINAAVKRLQDKQQGTTTDGT